MSCIAENNHKPNLSSSQVSRCCTIHQRGNSTPWQPSWADLRPYPSTLLSLLAARTCSYNRHYASKLVITSLDATVRKSVTDDHTLVLWEKRWLA